MTELFSGGGWRVVQESAHLPDGRVKEAARVERADSVHIIAFIGERRILLLREFRPFYGVYIWMLPGGRADKEMDLPEAAKRELQEETGYRAGDLTHYSTTNHSESLKMSNHIFLAQNLTKAPLPQDADELIEVHEVPIKEALDRILGSEKIHTPSAFALLQYLRAHP